MSRLRCLTAALCAGFLPHAHGATLLAYGFETTGNAFSNAPTELAPGVSAGAWLDTDATLTSFTGNPGRALGAKSFHDGNRLLLAVTAGDLLAPTVLRFDQQASATGPRRWSVFVNGVLAANGTPTTSFGAVEIMLKLAPTKRLEFALEGTGASSSQGTWRIDNLRLEGSLLPVPAPVPLPAAAALLLTALPLLPRRKRRVSPL